MSADFQVGPNKTAYDVCLELCSNTKLLVHEVVLEEIVLNDKLSRPIHHEEKVKIYHTIFFYFISEEFPKYLYVCYTLVGVKCRLEVGILG